MYSFMAFRNRIGRCILRPMFNDTVTIFNKVSDTEWEKTVVKGVQWAERFEKKNDNGKISVVRYVSITFPKGTYEGLVLEAGKEEDCIVYGEISDVLKDEKGSRVSDLMEKYPRSGLIQSVNDNSGRDFLKNIKVVIA